MPQETLYQPSPSQPDPNQSPPPNNIGPKPKPKILLIVVVAIIVLLAIIYFVFFNNNKNQNTTSTASTSKTAIAISSATSGTLPASSLPIGETIDTSEWKTYTNQTYPISFKYPGEWSVDIDAASTTEPVYSVEIGKGTSKMLTVGIWKTTDASPSTLEQEKSDLDKKAKADKTNIMAIDFSIADNPAVKYDFTSGPVDETGKQSASVIVNGVFYHFKYAGESSSEFNDILNSIQFGS